MTRSLFLLTGYLRAGGTRLVRYHSQYHNRMAKKLHDGQEGFDHDGTTYAPLRDSSDDDLYDCSRQGDRVDGVDRATLYLP